MLDFDKFQRISGVILLSLMHGPTHTQLCGTQGQDTRDEKSDHDQKYLVGNAFGWILCCQFKMLEAVDTSPVCPVCLKSCELLLLRALHDKGAMGEIKLASVFLKKQHNHIMTNPPPFCLLAESLLPPTQPQLESLYLQQSHSGCDSPFPLTAPFFFPPREKQLPPQPLFSASKGFPTYIICRRQGKEILA